MIYQKNETELALDKLFPGAPPRSEAFQLEAPLLFLIYFSPIDVECVGQGLKNSGVVYLPHTWYRSDIIGKYLEKKPGVKTLKAFARDLLESQDRPIAIPIHVNDYFAMFRANIFDLTDVKSRTHLLTRQRSIGEAVVAYLESHKFENDKLDQLGVKDFDWLFEYSFLMRQKLTIISSFMEINGDRYFEGNFEKWRTAPEQFYNQFLRPIGVKFNEADWKNTEGEGREETEGLIIDWFEKRWGQRMQKWQRQGWPQEAV